MLDALTSLPGATVTLGYLLGLGSLDICVLGFST